MPGGVAVPDDDLPDAQAAPPPTRDAYGMPGGDISAGQLFGDMGKAVIGGVVHAAGNLADVFTGTAPGPESHASRWSSPFAVTDRLGQLDPNQELAHQALSNSYDRVFGTGPGAQTIKDYLPQATEAVGTVLGAGDLASAALEKPAAMSPEDIVNNQAQSSAQSQGAAAAAPRLGQTSPEIRQAIVQAAQKTGGAVNPDALVRHVEADTLPVPVRLTEGQALQDPVRISAEQNMRGQANGALAERFNQQNGHLIQNVQAIRDEVGPDVFTTNPVEHGDTLIKAYQDKDAALRADITAKYKALADANGGDLPLDGKTFVDSAQAALKKQMKAPFLPPGVQSTLSELGSGPMTFENFENLRTTLAAEGRKAARAGDGNAEGAINIVRDQLENVPVSGQTAAVKGLADQARSAAKARFDALRADPAYKAAVDGSVPPDRFVSKFVTGGTRDNVARMQQAFADDPVAQQTMGVAAVDHLRRSAGIDDMGNGNFSQAGFNKQLQALNPKLRALVGPAHADTLDQLGTVARYTQVQPRGAFVNNSNTLVGALAEHGSNLLEGVANAKTGGIGGTLARGVLNKRATRAAVQRALAPGAGLDQLQ